MIHMEYLHKREEYTVTFCADEIELQAGFSSSHVRQEFVDYLNKEYGKLDADCNTDFRGMPTMNYKYNSHNEIVLCGSDTENMIDILAAFNRCIKAVSDKVNSKSSGISEISW